MAMMRPHVIANNLLAMGLSNKSFLALKKWKSEAKSFKGRRRKKNCLGKEGKLEKEEMV